MTSRTDPDKAWTKPSQGALTRRRRKAHGAAKQDTQTRTSIGQGQAWTRQHGQQTWRRTTQGLRRGQAGHTDQKKRTTGGQHPATGLRVSFQKHWVRLCSERTVGDKRRTHDSRRTPRGQEEDTGLVSEEENRRTTPERRVRSGHRLWPASIS